MYRNIDGHVYVKTSHASSRQPVANLEKAIDQSLLATGFNVVRRGGPDEDNAIWLEAHQATTFPSLPVAHVWEVWLEAENRAVTNISVRLNMAATAGTWLWVAAMGALVCAGIYGGLVWPDQAWLAIMPLLVMGAGVAHMRLKQIKMEKTFWATLAHGIQILPQGFTISAIRVW